ncbi:J domain-containing protein [Ekhidna sp. MALMAid0563]|uniref:J domain-containing protein n=1 Tax=Ekhidna sp. MALMAid0563 TaxID=3143937 RepID=UPI0032DF5F65
MNHYEVLGIKPAATQAEIKKAYRKLVKQYHPDINADISAADKMVIINDAYEVLSNPTSRNLYDMFLQGVPVKTDIVEATPYQRYKEEYRAKRVKRERDRIIYLVKLKTRFYRYERMMNKVFFIIAIILTVDYYYQPNQTHEGVETINKTPFETNILLKDGRRIFTSQSFYDQYMTADVGRVNIKYSLFFKIPVRIQAIGDQQDFIVNGSIYTFRNVFSVIILIFSAIVVGNKEYTGFRLSCGLVPGFFVLFMLLFILTEI